MEVRGRGRKVRGRGMEEEYRMKGGRERDLLCLSFSLGY